MPFGGLLPYNGAQMAPRAPQGFPAPPPGAQGLMTPTAQGDPLLALVNALQQGEMINPMMLPAVMNETAPGATAMEPMVGTDPRLVQSVIGMLGQRG